MMVTKIDEIFTYLHDLRTLTRSAMILSELVEGGEALSDAEGLRAVLQLKKTALKVEPLIEVLRGRATLDNHIY
jgi:hypothetical protein